MVDGASAAAAVLLSGAPAIRTTPVNGAPRLPYCMIGICFDCLAEIDGDPITDYRHVIMLMRLPS